MSDSIAAQRASIDPGHRGWYWIPVVLLALGIGSILMLLASDWVRGRLMEHDIYLARAVGQIQTNTAVAHLWVEELVTGDAVDRSEIGEHLAQAKRLIVDIESSTPSSGLGKLFASEEDEPIARLAATARQRLDSFTEISKRREDGYAMGSPVGIGSPIDVRYDQVFQELFTDLHALEQLLESRLLSSEARTNAAVRLILAVWSLIVASSAAAIFNRERHRREAEEALHRSEEQLLQAQKMEAVGRLAGGIAHDINNHLAAMTAQCELVKMGADERDPVCGKMDAVIQTAGKSASLIRQLLAFSRREPVLAQTVNVNEVFEGVAPMFDRLIGEDVTFSTELDGDLWNVSIDPSQLEQILLNLVVNARDAMPLGGELSLSTYNVEHRDFRSSMGERIDPGTYVCIRVSDTGCGIPDEIRDNIFEPFFSTKDRSQSSGLGLATVHGIVRQNLGYIELDSRSGVGTTFRIYLLKSEGPAVARSSAPAAALSPAVQPAHVLLVEDNDDLRGSTMEIMQMLGYSVTPAGSAEQALEIFAGARRSFDIVVTDVIMPGMDGKRLVDRLKRHRNDLRVVFISGYTDDVMLDRGVARGEVNFVPKPFSASMLADKLREVLAREPLTSAA